MRARTLRTILAMGLMANLALSTLAADASKKAEVNMSREDKEQATLKSGKNPPISYPNAAGIKFPQVLNNINNTSEGDLMAIGFPTGVVVSELFCGFRVQAAGCYTGLFIGLSSHYLVIQNVVSQWNHFGIAVNDKGAAHMMISSYSVEVDDPDDGAPGWEGTPAWTGNGDDYHDPKDNGRGLIYYCAWNKGHANLRITNGGKQKITITNLGK